MHTKYKGPLLIAMTAVLWSTGGVLIKLVPWNAMTIVGLRSFFAAAVMAVYMRRPRITFSKPVILGGVLLSVTMGLFLFANKLTTAANAIVLQYTSPIFVILLSALMLRQRPRVLDIAAVAVVFGGIMLFFIDQLRADALLGNILAVLTGVTFAAVSCQQDAWRPARGGYAAGLSHQHRDQHTVYRHQRDGGSGALAAVIVMGVFQLGLRMCCSASPSRRRLRWRRRSSPSSSRF